ncbi:MAG: hypothetical protein JKX70_00155, partial [Phycisphaerales bacterium]|nr:hypothetical protein [Phycisphaerales bacterium]
REKTNAAFCDGHVETTTLQDLGYIVNPDGSIPALNDQATNAKFTGDRINSPPPKLNR